MTSNALIVRSWNGQAIQRRRSDGYVNATAMCKANGKLWTRYRGSDHCQAYINALVKTSGIPTFDLIECRKGRGGGTWIHPRLAVDLARWISPSFAVWMDGWFLEELEAQASAAKQLQSETKHEAHAQPLIPEGLSGYLFDLVCSDIARINNRVSALLGFPTKAGIADATDLLENVAIRVRIAQRLLDHVEPVQPKSRAKKDRTAWPYVAPAK